MKKHLSWVLLFVLTIWLGIGLQARPLSQPGGGCLRVMSSQELAKEANVIARISVIRVDPANFHGLYDQLATVKVTEVIDGDSTLKDRELKIWAQSRVACAADTYAKGDELLVFLVREAIFFRTLNYQYGQFHLQNEQVMGWRDKDKGESARNYPDVATEIRVFLNPTGAGQATSAPPAISTASRPRP